MSRDLGEWIRSGKHLPAPLRDFHDQKDAFKSLHGWMDKAQATGRPWTPPSWVDGHIYVIDYFLRFMALCGWTLQRSRQPVRFASLAETIKEDRERSAVAFATASGARAEEPT